MLELKNNKHHIYYLYIVNAVIFKLLLTSYLKRDLAKKNNNEQETPLICLAISSQVCFIVNSSTCTVHTYRELKLRYSQTPTVNIKH